MSGQNRSFSLPEWAMLPPISNMINLSPDYPQPLSHDLLQQAILNAIDENFPVFPRDARRIQILVEDASRPTKTAPVLSILIQELRKRLPSVELNILIAGGAHQGLDNRWKLPQDMVNKARVHDPHQSKFCGEFMGIPLLIDPGVIDADVRIAVGTVNIHPKAGFSGGSKILLPGTAGLPTIKAFHRQPDGESGTIDTPLRQMADQALQRFPVLFALQLLSNGSGEIWGLTSGELHSAWLAATEELLPHVRIRLEQQYPYCLADAKPFDQNLIGLFKSLKTLHAVLTPNGEGILLARAHEGLGSHAWRLDPSVIERERLSLEMLLGNQTIWVVSQAQLPPDDAMELFPPQIRLVPPGYPLPMLQDVSIMLHVTPLMGLEIAH